MVIGCSNTSNENDSVFIPEVNEPVNTINKGRATLDSLNALIIDNPNNLDVLESRAALYLGARNLAYAKADIDAVLAVDSNRLRALYILGRKMAVNLSNLSIESLISNDLVSR